MAVSIEDIKEPSLNQKGYKEKKCTRCNNILREDDQTQQNKHHGGADA